ncbi:hypothetical protein [Zavarzinella formosa]|uniref:hypothetical protein n=1 Tax=Zavarzinella formosa TaxID=360055 RepID=UPI000375FC38|nr:hypothetical protein [Zavarzinella formosa]
MSAIVDSRFSDKFHEQVRFLSRSSAMFDQGAEDEALRIATSLRVLLHDTKSSTSLFTYLGLTSTQMLTSSRGHGNWQDYLSHVLNPNSSEPLKMRPLLGDKFLEVTFARWWSDEPVFIHQSKDYSRRIICLSAANKDGGAHVDSDLEEYYETLAAGRYMFGITGNFEYGGHLPPFPQGVTIYPKNAHFALIRQFAHEFLCSAGHYKWG